MSTSTAHKKYIRDKRSPLPKNEVVSRVMRANKSKNTGLEIKFREVLWGLGLRGYRLHKRVGGTRPDLVFSKYKTAIFLNGCYWHRCPYCKLPLPKHNLDYWTDKFNKNKARDKAKVVALKKEGWRTYTFWECQIKKDALKYAKRISLEIK